MTLEDMIAKLEKVVLKSVQHLSLFSSNEKLKEMQTEHLRYLLDYLGSWPCLITSDGFMADYNNKGKIVSKSPKII